MGRTSQNQTCVCTTLYDYEAQGDDELSLRHGEIIEVLSQDVKISGDEGWWIGKINGKVRELQYYHLLMEMYSLCLTFCDAHLLDNKSGRCLLTHCLS